MDVLSLPIIMIENIISYLSYDEIAKNRVVCRSFNEICKRMLNRGFLMIERRHAIALKTVKAQLPRRESERRYHPLSRHCDILSSIETRISMLNMTYSKFIDCGLCCFIPGKVIDEISRVLSIVELSGSPPRAHEVLQELRDISSMAIEHFDDKISPALRKRLQDSNHHPHHPHHSQTEQGLAPMALKQELSLIRRRSKLNERLTLYLAAQYKKNYKRMVFYRKLILKQRRTIRELSVKQTDQDASIADLKKRIEECDIKYSELTHTNQAVGGKAIAASSTTTVSPVITQPLRHFASQIKLDLSVLPIGTASRNNGKLLPNIKPRKPVIKLPPFPGNSRYDYNREDSLADRVTPEPSTSREIAKPQKKPQTTFEKIKDFAQEIRNLAKSGDMSPRLGKRSVSMSDLDSDSCDHKKKKND